MPRYPGLNSTRPPCLRNLDKARQPRRSYTVPPAAGQRAERSDSCHAATFRTNRGGPAQTANGYGSRRSQDISSAEPMAARNCPYATRHCNGPQVAINTTTRIRRNWRRSPLGTCAGQQARATGRRRRPPASEGSAASAEQGERQARGPKNNLGSRRLPACKLPAGPGLGDRRAR